MSSNLMSSFSQLNKSDISKHTKSSVNMHEVIQRYKDSQRQKSILKNKLNILQYECLKNQRKAKSIESSLKKVNKIKQNYKKDKTSIQYLLRKNKQKLEQKIDQVKIKKQQSRGNLPYIKSLLERQKSQDYLLIKKKSREFEEKIKIYKNNIINERQKSVNRIKQQQQMISFHKTLYMEKKLSNAKKHEDQQSSRIQRKMKRSRLEFQNMKNLQDSLLEKLHRSRAKLNKSMSRMNTTIRC